MKNSLQTILTFITEEKEKILYTEFTYSTKRKIRWLKSKLRLHQSVLEQFTNPADKYSIDAVKLHQAAKDSTYSEILDLEKKLKAQEKPTPIHDSIIKSLKTINRKRKLTETYIDGEMPSNLNALDEALKKLITILTSKNGAGARIKEISCFTFRKIEELYIKIAQLEKEMQKGIAR